MEITAIPYSLVSAYTNGGKGLVDLVRKYPYLANTPICWNDGQFREYLIHVVSRVCMSDDMDYSFMDYVLSLGVDVNVGDWKERTPLMMAANIHVFRKLIAAGANPMITRKDGYTVWHNYASRGQYDILLEMKKLGLKCPKTTYHRTPLQLYSSYLENAYMEYENADEEYRGENPLYNDDYDTISGYLASHL